RNNRRPQRRQMHLIAEALGEGQSVVVDNTNPTEADRAPIIAEARRQGAEVVSVFFDAPIEGCLERNRGRGGRERVPDRALFVTRSRLLPPSFAEGFDRLYRVGLTPGCGFTIEECDSKGA